MILEDVDLQIQRKTIQWKEVAFLAASFITLAIGIFVLISLVVSVISQGLPRLNLDFLMGYPSRKAANAGVLPALVGSFYLMILTGLFSIPIGVGAAVYLEEYAKKNVWTRLIELNIANLAGVPSIIYGLLGLELFVRYLGLQRSILAGALTMAILSLPGIIIATREALRTVPVAMRQAGFSLGYTQLQVIQKCVLPLALPGIMTGLILAFSRVIGETAPLIMIGALSYIAFLPDGLSSPFTVLPIQIFNWVSRPQTEFHHNAAGAIVVLLAMLLVLNVFAIWIRVRCQRKLYW